jgi:VanZ family protein
MDIGGRDSLRSEKSCREKLRRFKGTQIALRFEKCLLLALYMGLLVWMSLGTRYPEPVELLFRKIGSLALHGLGYFFLVILLGWVLMVKSKREALLVFAAAFFYGLALEVAQIYTSTREFSWVDMLANLAGLSVGALALWVFDVLRLKGQSWQRVEDQ